MISLAPEMGEGKITLCLSVAFKLYFYLFLLFSESGFFPLFTPKLFYISVLFVSQPCPQLPLEVASLPFFHLCCSAWDLGLTLLDGVNE